MRYTPDLLLRTVSYRPRSIHRTGAASYVEELQDRETRYPTSMDIPAIVRELDAEIDRLKRIRQIVQGLLGGAPLPAVKQLRKPKAVVKRPSAATPQLIVLPPKQKREYRPRLKPIVVAPRALAPAPSDKPVFVPSASPVVLIPNVKDIDVEVLETNVRKNLLGRLA